jgi:ribosomal protein L33
MAKKKKSARILIKMKSTESTHIYHTQKNRRNDPHNKFTLTGQHGQLKSCPCFVVSGVEYSQRLRWRLGLLGLPTLPTMTWAATLRGFVSASQ